MKLLLDQNLSPKLVAHLADSYSGSAHVHELGLSEVTDSELWEYARENGFTLVSKDSDFADLSVVSGLPPKFVWIRRGNCTTAQIVALFDKSESELQAFLEDEDEGVLELW